MLPRFKVQEVKVVLEHKITGAEGRARGNGPVKSTDCRQRWFALELRVPWPKGGQSGTADHEQSHYEAIHDLVALTVVVVWGIGCVFIQSQVTFSYRQLIYFIREGKIRFLAVSLNLRQTMDVIRSFEEERAP